MKFRRYPDFPEYILLDLVDPNNVTFKRGVGEEFLLHREFEVWNQYFVSPSYAPPEGKDILLFHTCTWSKPYDFSFIGESIRKVTDKYPRVHRVILSNAGVIPYEYQMNPTFCCYDWKPTEVQRRDKAEILKLQQRYRQVTLQRIKEFLYAHGSKYKSIGLLGLPIKQGGIQSVYRIACELRIPFFHAPTVDTFRSRKHDFEKLCDPGVFFTFPEVLEDLNNALGTACGE